jgi:hypothetical protein
MMNRETLFRIALTTTSILATMAAAEIVLRIHPPAVLRYKSFGDAQIPYSGPPLHPDQIGRAHV